MAPRYGATAEYIQRVFGGNFEELDGNVATGAAPVQIVPSNPDAVALTIINVGANNVFVRIGNQPSAVNGILLTANGGFVTINIADDLTLVAREWFGVSPGGASTVYFLRVQKNASVSVPGGPSTTVERLGGAA